MLFTEFDMDTAIETWKKEEKIEIAKNLLAILDVKDINMISKATGLSIEEIKKLM